MSGGRFRTKARPFWADIVDGALEETDEEARAFDAAIREKIAWKTHASEPGKNSVSLWEEGEDSIDWNRTAGGTTHTTVEDGTALWATTSLDPPGTPGRQQEDATGVLEPSGIASDPVIEASAPVLVPAASDPGEVPNGGIKHKGPLSRATASEPALTTPSRSSPHLTSAAPLETLPSVPTPQARTPKLPPPPVSLRTSSRLRNQDTPGSIASPIDTPQSSRPSTNIQVPVDGTPVPVPLGSAAFSSLRGKKDYQTLTKTFELFTKNVAKDQAAQGSSASGAAPRAPRGRQAVNRSRSGMVGLAGLGGKIFEGLRFCIPPELGQVSKHKQRWDIISKLGGQVTLQPDTAITHIVYDKTSASILCRELGLQTLSELPTGTVCVKWDWVVSCKLAGKVLDTGSFLSFPKNALTRPASAAAVTRASSRIADITDQLRTKSMSITRRRAPTASDSDTESPKKPRTATAIALSRTISRAVSRGQALGGPGLSTAATRSGLGGVATEHAVPKGPGWEVVHEAEKDGLDDMISGVKNGSVEDPDADDIESAPHGQNTDLGGEADSNPNPELDKWRCGQSHPGDDDKGPNEWLAKKFDEMHDMYQGVAGKNFFSIRQYQQAASIMRRTQLPITSGAQALKIKGVGSGIADRIDEFISGGPGRQFYEDNEQTRIVASFKDIYGVGRTFANDLYRRGARSIEDLRTHDYGLTPGQMLGLDMYEDLKARIPREECRQIFEIIQAEARALDPKVWIEIMGSYRRGQPDSGDVDILITRDTADGLNHTAVLHGLVNRLKMRGVITHDLGVPHDWKALEAKWMGVGRLSAGHKYRRIDILCIPFEQWGAALIYFTGNEIFNRSLRLYARKKGYSLNQRGLSVGVIRDKQGLKMTEGEIIASRTEQEIFDVLGLRWRHPHHRRP